VRPMQEFQGHTTTPQVWPKPEADLNDLKTSNSGIAIAQAVGERGRMESWV
jgi:hypothetical protein